jgi:hypothetical protein
VVWNVITGTLGSLKRLYLSRCSFYALISCDCLGNGILVLDDINRMATFLTALCGMDGLQLVEDVNGEFSKIRSALYTTRSRVRVLVKSAEHVSTVSISFGID